MSITIRYQKQNHIIVLLKRYKNIVESFVGLGFRLTENIEKIDSIHGVYLF
jgi:hypothetical protein